MNDTIFLEKVHSAISKKRKTRQMMISFFSVVMMAVVSYNSMLVINQEKLQTQWDLMQTAEIEIYHLDEYPSLTDHEKLEYLIEEMEINDVFSEFDEIILEQIKMNGA